MIIVRLKGGLGNQLFQYAFGKSIQEHSGREVKFDISFFNKNENSNYFDNRDLDLEIFNIELNSCSDDELNYFGIEDYSRTKFIIKKFTQKYLPFAGKSDSYYIEPSFSFNEDNLNISGKKVLEGYWQSEKYFKQIESKLRKELSFKNQLPNPLIELKNEMKCSNSICLHIRYGYMNNLKDRLYHGFVGSDYFVNAIKYISNKIDNPKFYLFSDNVEWCKQNIKSEYDITFVEKDYPGFESNQYFQLMTNCKHFVISNSSFSWWAAWLSNNSDKTVVAPKQWFRVSLNDTKDLIPEEWIHL